MFEKFKEWLFWRKIRNANAETIAIADEYLKRAMRTNSDAISTAERLNRANIINANTRQLKETLQKTLNDEYEDEEEEEDYNDEDEEEEGDKLLNEVAKKYIMPKLFPNISAATTPAAAAQVSEIRQKAQGALNMLTDEQLEKYGKKFGLL